MIKITVIFKDENSAERNIFVHACKALDERINI